MKKLSIGLLDELAKNQQRISELEMKGFLGGGSGTIDDPYSEYEATIAIDFGTFNGGYVEDSHGIVSYWHKEIIVTPYGVYSSPYGAYGYIYGSYSDWGQYGSYGYESYYNGQGTSNTLENALTGAGIGVGVEVFLEDIVEQICRSDAARQQLYSAAKASVKAGKIAGNISKGCGVVGLVLSIGGSYHSLVAVVDGTAEAADYLNGISILSATAGVVCAFTGVGLPVTLVCDGVSIGCSIAAEIVEQ